MAIGCDKSIPCMNQGREGLAGQDPSGCTGDRLRENTTGWRVRVLYAVALSILLLGTTLSVPDNQSASQRFLRSGPHKAGTAGFTLVDSSRSTAANSGIPEKPERTLHTTVWYPARERPLELLRPDPKPLAASACPCPLVIFNHGFMSFRSNGAYLARHLASHGYIVAAANFPLTSFGAAGGPQFRDLINQPGDVSFLIDQILSWSRDPKHRFTGVVDHERIGAVGLSLGGMTTTLLAFHRDFRDPRIRSAVSIAGPSAIFNEQFFTGSDVPFLMIAGDIDAMVDYQSNAMVLRERAPQATLVTLRGGSHTGFAGVASPFLEWLDNPDSLGCWFMRDQFEKGSKGQQAYNEFIMSMGGLEAGIEATELPELCGDASLPPALKPKRQHELTILAVFSFFQSSFHPNPSQRSEYRRALANNLARENPELEVNLDRWLVSSPKPVAE